VAKEWYDKDWDLPPEMAFLAGHGLDQGALVFDLGAHQCLIAMMLAKQVGPQGHVVAVEANRHNVSVARRNVALNRVDNVTVTHAMISNRAGRERAEASFNSSHGASAIAGDMVDTLTIDDMSERLGRPRVVFMDIEGFEIEALKGAHETLRQRCTWFVELHGDATLQRYGSANHDVLRFFPADRFTAYVCREDEQTFQPLAGEVPRERCFMVFVPAA